MSCLDNGNIPYMQIFSQVSMYVLEIFVGPNLNATGMGTKIGYAFVTLVHANGLKIY